MGRNGSSQKPLYALVRLIDAISARRTETATNRVGQRPVGEMNAREGRRMLQHAVGLR